MEYHAIEEASSFDRIKDVLIKKAAAGVEVRLFYDDVEIGRASCRERVFITV